MNSLVREHERHPVSIDGCKRYPMACKILKLNHHVHSSFAKKEKSLFEGTLVHKG